MGGTAVLPGWISMGDPGEYPPRRDEEPPEWCGCWADELAVAASVAGPSDTPPAGWVVPGVPRPSPAVPALLTGLSAALDAVQAHGPLSGSRADTGLLLRLAERARGAALRELAEMDVVGGHLVAGEHPTTTASWLRDELCLTEGAARAAVRLATQLRDVLPRLGVALADGEVTVEHAAAVVSGVHGLDRDVVAAADEGLCGLARVSDPTSVRRTLRDKAAAVDDRLAADAERRARDRQGLRIGQTGATTVMDAVLAGEDGATVRQAMALQVEASRNDGDTRGLAARRADVLVRWATDALRRIAGSADSLARDVHSVRSRLLVTCTPEQLAAAGLVAAQVPDLSALLSAPGAGPVSAGIVGDDGPLSRGALRRLACDATVDLVVRLDPRTHECARNLPGRVCEHLRDPLYVGRSARTVTGLQFTALVVRDRTCVVRGCHRAPVDCDAHHVVHWADGGSTDLDNLVLLCRQHHHDHHDRGLDLPHHDGLRWLTRTGWAHAPT